MLRDHNQMMVTRDQSLSLRQTLADILALILLFTNKIQECKQKLCGYEEFSPRTAFFTIDIEKKGYITIRDLQLFLVEKLTPDQLANLMKRASSDSRDLAYTNFLRLVKPYFDTRLASDILHRQPRPEFSAQIHDMFYQIILHHAIFCNELYRLKQQLQELHCANTNDIRRTLAPYSLQAKNWKEGLSKFLKDHGYAEHQDLRYLEAFLNAKPDFKSEYTLRSLFMPDYNNFYPDETLSKVQTMRQTLLMERFATHNNLTKLAQTSPQPEIMLGYTTTYNFLGTRPAKFTKYQGFLQVPVKPENDILIDQGNKSMRSHTQEVIRHSHVSVAPQSNNLQTPVLEQFMTLHRTKRLNQSSSMNSVPNRNDVLQQSAIQPINSSQAAYKPHTSHTLLETNILDRFIQQTQRHAHNPIRQQFTDSLKESSSSQSALNAFQYI